MSVAEELREYIERSNAIHREYLDDSDLLQQYRHFVAWQTDYLLPYYADLRLIDSYSAAVDFVVSDLIGVGVSQRDHDISRVAPIMSRMLSDKAVQTMAAAMRLNARVLEINLAICRAIYKEITLETEISGGVYIAACRRATNLGEVLELVHLTEDIGHSLDHLIRIPMIGVTLKAMRRPARLAGFGALQRFLETGYRTFIALEDVDRFLDDMVTRMTEVFTKIYGEAS